MKLVFVNIPKQRMPFFARPIAREISRQVLQRFVDPNIDAALGLLEQTLRDRPWLTGQRLALADFQMSFAVEAALAPGRTADGCTLPRRRRLPRALPCPTRVPARAGQGRAGNHGHLTRLR